MKTKFYTFRQNNSGGDFTVDRKAGIDKFVIVEARDHLEANVFAEDLGLYWNGVARDMDCGCCGDRWDPASKTDGHEFPTSTYGKEPVVFAPIPKKTKLMDDVGYVHYRDGRIESFYDPHAMEKLMGRLKKEQEV